MCSAVLELDWAPCRRGWIENGVNPRTGINLNAVFGTEHSMKDHISTRKFIVFAPSAFAQIKVSKNPDPLPTERAGMQKNSYLERTNKMQTKEIVVVQQLCAWGLWMQPILRSLFTKSISNKSRNMSLNETIWRPIKSISWLRMIWDITILLSLTSGTKKTSQPRQHASRTTSRRNWLCLLLHMCPKLVIMNIDITHVKVCSNRTANYSMCIQITYDMHVSSSCRPIGTSKCAINMLGPQVMYHIKAAVSCCSVGCHIRANLALCFQNMQQRQISAGCSFMCTPVTGWFARYQLVAYSVVILIMCRGIKEIHKMLSLHFFGFVALVMSNLLFAINSTQT